MATWKLAAFNPELSNLELNRQSFSTTEWTYEQYQTSPYPAPVTDCDTLDAHIARQLSRIAAGEHEFNEAEEKSDRGSLAPRLRSIAHAGIGRP